MLVSHKPAQLARSGLSSIIERSSAYELQALYSLELNTGAMKGRLEMGSVSVRRWWIRGHEAKESMARDCQEDDKETRQRTCSLRSDLS